MDVGQVTVTQDLGLGMFPFESFEQVKQSSLLSDCPGIVVVAVLVKASLIAHAQRMAVVSYGVGTDELLVACLIGLAIAGDVVVIARESEAIRVVTYELHHGIALVAAGGTAMNDDKINSSHGSS